MIFDICERFHEAQMSQNHGQYRWLVSEDVQSVRTADGNLEEFFDVMDSNSSCLMSAIVLL